MRSKSKSPRSRARSKDSIYTGELAEGLPPLQIGILAPEDERAKLIGERVEQELRKLVLLLAHFKITPGPNKWFDLSLALAQQHVPGFREKATAGRPQRWNMLLRWVLAGEVLREQHEGAASVAEASRRLAAKDLWRSFLSAGRWAEGKSRNADSGAALLEQWKKMPARYRKVGENAFQYHKAMNTIGEWQALVEDALKNPSPPEKNP